MGNTKNTAQYEITGTAKRVGHGLGRTRLYLYDAITGEELTDHPCHGAAVQGASHSAITPDRVRVEGTAMAVYVIRRNEDTGMWEWCTITAEHFPGRRVFAKCWHPEEDFRDDRLLARKSLCNSTPTTGRKHWREYMPNAAV